MTLDELLKRNIVGAQVFDPLARQLGLDGWQIDGGGMDESGNPINTGVADPSRLKALKGYTFDWQDTGPANTGTLTAYDPTGKMVGSYGQRDQTGADAFGEWAMLAGAGFGGAGLLGMGPLGGVLGGGAGQIGSSVAGAGGEAAANLAAYGASLTPAEVAAGVGGLEIGAGAAGAAAGGIPAAVSGAANWLKENPTLGRLALGGATSLLSAAGGSGGSSPAPVTPVQWNSPIQQGLLADVKQYAPEAIRQDKPAGLLAQGYANDGAWRYLKG